MESTTSPTKRHQPHLKRFVLHNAIRGTKNKPFSISGTSPPAMTFFLCRRKTIARIYMHDASIRHRPTAGTNFHIFAGAFIIFARLENSCHCSSFHCQEPLSTVLTYHCGSFVASCRHLRVREARFPRFRPVPADRNLFVSKLRMKPRKDHTTRNSLRQVSPI